MPWWEGLILRKGFNCTCSKTFGFILQKILEEYDLGLALISESQDLFDQSVYFSLKIIQFHSLKTFPMDKNQNFRHSI